MTLDLCDLDTIGENALRTFEHAVSRAGDNGVALEREAFKLSSQLEQFYSITAALARHETDMQQTAALWERLVRTCDVFAGKVFQLSQAHSFDPAAYDQILDIRSAAEELRSLHAHD